MKTLTIILIFFCLSGNASDRNWYKIYLRGEIAKHRIVPVRLNSHASVILQHKPSWAIPAFERPKGAIFCRMEDYLTTKTKVWIKVGVK